MRRIGSRALIACQLLAGASGIVATGCLAELWPNDDVSAPVVCESTYRAPTLDTSAGERIAIDATDRVVPVADVAAEGRGTDFVGALRLAHGVGTVELGCETLQVAVYDSFVAADGTLQVTALAVKSDRLYALQFECDEARLGSVWYETTDGAAIVPEQLSGSCSEVALPADSRVIFPAIDMPLPRTLTGYTIDGPEISLRREGRGSLGLDGVSHELFVFGDHRCVENCELDYWSSLEALIWDRSSGRLSYGLLYLQDVDRVTLRPRATLPGFVEQVGARTLTAAFAVP
jgi:hypothetical protein